MIDAAYGEWLRHVDIVVVEGAVQASKPRPWPAGAEAAAISRC